MMPLLRFTVLACLALFSAGSALATPVSVAVASNFYTTAQRLAADFTDATGFPVRLSQGATGQHYAQIRQGAPFDLFLAADTQRPARLEAEGGGISGTRVTYALGQLVLWVPNAAADRPAVRRLRSGSLNKIAIANPRLAPFGHAAQTVLASLGVDTLYADRLVLGNNVAQTYQFIATGHADGGLVARSQLIGTNPGAPAQWDVPTTLHAPIEQQMILITDTAAARAFWQFIQSEPARTQIRAAGYDVPEL